jgi:hypothetical protein
MLPVRGAFFVNQMVTTAFFDAESLVNFPHQKKPCIRRDLGTIKINKNGLVEMLLYSVCILSAFHRRPLKPSEPFTFHHAPRSLLHALSAHRFNI